jgi:RNA polymerase-associated protein RTF1
LEKNHDLNNLLERRWTDADIQKKIDRQNKFAHLDHPTITVNIAPKADQSARLDLVNKANRKANSEQIRKALIEERRAQLREREAREKKRKQKEEEEKAKLLKPPKSSLDDLFDGSDRSRSGTPSAMNKGSGKNTPVGKSEKKGGIPTFKKRNMDDDIISSMDLGIEIDI